MAFWRHIKYAQNVGLAVLICLFLTGVARATVPVTLKGETGPGYARILANWPEGQASEDVRVTAEIKNGVLIVRFSDTYEAETKPLLSDLPDTIALARLDADQQTLRIALRQPRDVRTSRSFNLFAIDLVEPDSDITPPKVISEREARIRQDAKDREIADIEAAVEAQKVRVEAAIPPVALPLSVRAAQTTDYTRIAFDWTKSVGHTLHMAGPVAEIVFDRPAVPNLSVLNVNIPRGLVNATSTIKDGKTTIGLELSPGFSARLWEDGTKVMVDLFDPNKQNKDAQAAKKPDEPERHAKVAPEAIAAPQPEYRQDPSPGNGIITANVTRIGTDLQVAFTFAAPVGNAAFRRGETIWVVFDDNASLDLTELERGASQHILGFETFQTMINGGVRFHVPPSTQVEAQVSEGGKRWVFAFGEKLGTPPHKLNLYREADGSAPGRLIADLPNATRIHTLRDPAIGDQISVVTALGPIIGVQSQRHFVDVTALPSAHGLAFEINADGVVFDQQDKRIVVRTPAGLSLTPSARATGIATNNRAQSSIAMPAVTAAPGFIDFAGWAKPDPKLSFNENYDAELRRVAAEETDPQARIAMARFLVANGLGNEALGMLDLAQRLDPMLVQDGQFRALRGTANVLMHRIKDARADFAAQTLNRDPSAALWRGYLAAEMEDWGAARREFDAGREAFYLFVTQWQARFRNAYARSALELNDLGTARKQIDEAMSVEAENSTRLHTRLIRAAYAEASGNVQEAIRHYQKVAEAGYEPLETQALFQKTRLQTEAGELKPAQAADILENLRYRWRGDNTELEEVLALGKIYGEMGDYNRALKAMNTAVMRFPDNPVTRRITDDMHTIFNNLFLHGGADTMDPVQALAMFYEFIDMVPIGSEGDRMLRLLADRLIDFDLLPQATELLQHQVDNRIRSGQARAQIAAKLALIYLMDRKPEKALSAIRNTRLARLPKGLNQQRRLIEARALIALGRTDHALELIDTDRTREAAILRANIAWQSKNWALAGPLMLGVVDRYIPKGSTLSEDDASLILRTAIALSLTRDKTGVENLREDYAAMMTDTNENETFDLVTQQKNLGNIPVKDLAPVLAETQDLRAVLKRYSERFETTQDTAPGAAGSL